MFNETELMHPKGGPPKDSIRKDQAENRYFTGTASRAQEKIHGNEKAVVMREAWILQEGRG